MARAAARVARVIGRIPGRNSVLQRDFSAASTLRAMVVLVGIMMSVTPGPTIIAIPGGLALLATGIPWVQKRLDRMKDTISKHTRGRRTGALGDGGSKQ